MRRDRAQGKQRVCARENKSDREKENTRSPESQGDRVRGGGEGERERSDSVPETI